jgi:hypothetical protein
VRADYFLPPGLVALDVGKWLTRSDAIITAVAQRLPRPCADCVMAWRIRADV